MHTRTCIHSNTRLVNVAHPQAGVARKWESFGESTFLQHPVKGTAAPYVQLDAIDPGIKGKKRAREKVDNDYEGDVRRLKDLARMTLQCEDCRGMLDGINGLREKDGWEIVQLKNMRPLPHRCKLANKGKRKNKFRPKL